MNRNDVLDKLTAGEPGTAIALLQRLLRDHPDDPDLLGLLGVALDDTGDAAGARDALERALAQECDVAIRLRNGANLAWLLLDTGKREDAAALLKRGWRWEEPRKPDENERMAMAALAEVMLKLALHAEAIDLLSPLPDLGTSGWQLLKPLVLALAHTGMEAQALQILDSHQPCDAVPHECAAIRAFLLHAIGKTVEAVRERNAYLASVPPVLLPRRDSQRFLIGVIENPPSSRRLLAPWPRAYFSHNYPSQPGRLFPDRYGLAGIFCGAGDEAVEQFAAWQPDVVINNVTHAEHLWTGDNLRHAQDFVNRVAPRAINPPKAAASCTRQMMPHTLADIEGLIAPSVRRFRCDLAQLDNLIEAIEGSTAYPMIVRTIYEQESRNMTLAHSRAELEAAIRSLNRTQFYVIEYLGQPREYGFFRRVRAAFVAGVPVIIRADYAREWIVRSRHYIDRQIYHDHPDLLAKANAIILNPREELGDRALAALQAAGQRIPLDIFGMDFDVDDAGNVICFEANATMGLMKPAPEPFPYPPQANHRLLTALDQLLQEVAASGRN